MAGYERAWADFGRLDEAGHYNIEGPGGTLSVPSAPARHGHRVEVEPMTGNVLLGYARLNVPDGLWGLYHQPWDRATSSR